MRDIRSGAKTKLFVNVVVVVVAGAAVVIEKKRALCRIHKRGLTVAKKKNKERNFFRVD